MRVGNHIIILVFIGYLGVVIGSDSNTRVVSEESEVKSINPTNNPTKVFVRRRIFRKIVKEDGNTTTSTTSKPAESSSTTSSATTTTRPRTLYSLVKKLDTSVVTGSSLKNQMSSSTGLNKKFNFQSLKSRLGLNNASSTPATNNNSLVLIPLPPSQRKPYTPVIMQVSSTTSKPKQVGIHKLDKMFVPIGIYGKVIENGSTTESPAEQTSTLKTSIRHKGTEYAGEKVRKVKGIADTIDITYGRPNLNRYSLTTQRPDINGISFTTESEHEAVAADTNELRRVATSSQYDSGLRLMTPPKLGTSKESSPSTLTDALGSYSSYAQYNTKKPHSTMLDSITDSMSRIPSLVPSLFHKGLTSLASYTSSLKENPFVDDQFNEHLGAKKSSPLVSGVKTRTKIPASVPGGYIGASSSDNTVSASNIKETKISSPSYTDISEYEALEYFRKRPHLLAQLKRERALAQKTHHHRVRMSKGFKPVNAPEYLAREYYKTTSTSSAPPQESVRSGKKIRGSWLLRNSNEYVGYKNDRVAKMWREMLDTFTVDDPNYLTHRASSSSSSALTEKWTQIKRKYDAAHINEAKERILTLLDSGYGDEALHEFADDEELQHVHAHAHMPPPPRTAVSLTKGLSSAAVGAFKDLVKFFKLGISVGAGHSHEPVQYQDIADEQEASQSDWRPVSRSPLISFSAGISLKSPGKPKHVVPHHHDFHHDESPHHVHEYSHVEPHSHYSGSSKPYIPNTYSYGDHELSPTPYSYVEEHEIVGSSVPEAAAAVAAAVPPPSHDHEQSDVQEPEGYETESYASESSYFPVRSQPPSSSSTGSLLSSSSLSSAASSWSSVRGAGGLSPPDEYELVPSSVYLNGQGDPNDIAAVVKPAGVSEDLIRSALPPGMRNLRIIEYPHSNLNSVSNALRSPTEFKRAMKALRESYVQKESAYLPPREIVRVPPQTTRNPYRGLNTGSLNTVYYNAQPNVVAPHNGLVSALSGLESNANVFGYANKINDFQSGASYLDAQNYAVAAAQKNRGAAGQKDALGFTTDYNLPSNLDPDIAALLKSELDKDDIPDDVRQEFLEAKEQEAKEQKAKQQQVTNTRRSDDNVEIAKQALIDELLNNAAKAKVSSSSSAVQRTQVSRNFNVVSGVTPQTSVATRFFAPIPITPTLMTTALKNPRYSSPVPRYVIELANKLQGDRNVQGIVRVSAKRGRGLPPIEYLYPVRG